VPKPRDDDDLVEQTRRHRPAAVLQRQASLFGERSKVISLDAYGTLRRTEGHPSRRPAAAQGRILPAPLANQQALDFRQRTPQPRASLRDEAAVASCGRRFRAVLIDTLLCGLGLALAAVAFHLMGGRVALSAATAPGFAIAAGALLAFYHLFWSVLGRESPGMAWCRLRVMTFDGYPPSWRLRVVRFLAACLGLAALGLGPLWALLDEERLAWQDHISKTYPAVENPNAGTLHRG
jgi:uncharacterized RDD family membrane protein YckC